MIDMKSQLESINNKMNSLFNMLANSKDQGQIDGTTKILFDSGLVTT